MKKLFEIVEALIETVHGRRNVATICTEMNLRSSELTGGAVPSAHAEQEDLVDFANDAKRKRQFLQEEKSSPQCLREIEHLEPLVGPIVRVDRFAPLDLEEKERLG